MTAPEGHHARSEEARARAAGERNPVSMRTITFVVGLLIFLYLIREILFPFVVAAIVAYVATPLIDRLAARTRLPRALFAVVVFLLLLSIGALIGWLGIPPLVREVTQVVNNLQGTIEELVRRTLGEGQLHILGTETNAQEIARAGVEDIRRWVGQIGKVLAIATVGFAGLFMMLLTLVLTIYFLIGGRSVGRGIFWLAPPSKRPLMAEIWSELDPILRRYFIGVAIIVTYAAAAAYIGLGVVLGIHHAGFLALLTGLLEMVPMFGPLTAAVLAGLVAMQYAASIWDIAAYAIYATALRLSIDQLIGPIILGRAAQVHPILVIFCFLSGGLLFGAVGVILALPVAITIKVVLATLYGEPLDDRREHRRKRRAG